MEKRSNNIVLLILALTFALVFVWHRAWSNELNNVCDECWPHPSNWGEVEQHGVFAFDQYKSGADATIGQICQECHGPNLTGGFTGVSCYSCHSAFPHYANWKEPANHGVYALNNGVASKCQNACHGIDYLGGYAEVSCYDCHKPFPHPAEWADLNSISSNNFHGNYVLQNVPMKLSEIDQVAEDNTCRGQCHGTMYEGGLSNKACSDCHEAYPHMFNWSRPDTHGIYAITFGVEDSCGIGCHGANYEGGNTEISCYDCHENFPHDNNYAVGHQGMNPDEAYQCATLCHGGDLEGGLSNSSCTSCHNNIAWPLYKLMSTNFPFLFPH